MSELLFETPSDYALLLMVSIFCVSVSLYVASKRECIERFGLKTIERINTDNGIICTTEYSRIVPLENGEVTASEQSGSILVVLFQKCSSMILIQ